MMYSRYAMLGLCVLATVMVRTDVSAQQATGSDAVETFSPQLDAGYEMRPSVGMFGITELMMAALEADVDQVRRLLDQGTDIDETDQTGGTPLMWAVQGGDLGVVDLLLERGANVNATASRNTTALMTAVISDKEAIGVRLLEAGAGLPGIRGGEGPCRPRPRFAGTRRRPRGFRLRCAVFRDREGTLSRC